MKAKKFRKTMVWALCFAAVFAIFLPSCENAKQDAKNPEKQDGADEDTKFDSGDLDPRLAVADDLPEKDYGGEKFAIIYIDWSSYQRYQFADEEIGEAMNDAIYYRQKHTEERFNIEIAPINLGWASGMEIISAIGNTVKAGSHEYDLALTHCGGLVPLMTENYVLDWNAIPAINFSKPWWNRDATETLSIRGKLYFAVSDFIIPEPNAVFFNKGMVADYGLENPYALVRSGQWTIDKMHEMAKVVAKDLDGDGQWTDQDQYGLVTQFDWYFHSIGPSCNVKGVAKDDDGRLVINAEIEKMHSILEKYDALINDKTITFTFPYGAMGDQYISALPMSTGRVLFHFDPLPQAVRYRDSEVDYGILPWPKYDEIQEKYINLSWNGFMAIPSTVNDPEKEGVIIEALSAESYKYCVPAFYDVLMNVKLTRDEESIEMLDIIYSGCVYDLDINYEIYIGGIRDLLQKKNTDYASYFEKNADAKQKMLDKILDAVESNG
ncbi:MAG: hypothetical protein FWG34_02145 [Oscillospiraceae bacterium]|nr:hypothetical protein [Oscillospiraceae bacterium]